MTDHNCVRNPNTGACYVCNTPMRQNFYVSGSPLDAIIDNTQHPRETPTVGNSCQCGAYIKANESQCIDCWILEQTKQPAPQAKPVKQTKEPVKITLDSILAAMETNPQKWN